MSAMFLAMLFIREQSLLSETLRQMAGAPPEQIAEASRTVRLSAFNNNLLSGLAIIYFKACLLASLTLFVSTFASSNLFTIVVMVFVYFIGHLQATAREYWLQENSAGWMTRVFLAFVALFFPDLQLFNLVDDIVVGTAIPVALLPRRHCSAVLTPRSICCSRAPYFTGRNYDSPSDGPLNRGDFRRIEIAHRAQPLGAT